MGLNLLHSNTELVGLLAIDDILLHGTRTAGSIAETTDVHTQLQPDVGTSLDVPCVLGIHQVGIGIAVGTEVDTLGALNLPTMPLGIGKSYVVHQTVAVVCGFM